MAEADFTQERDTSLFQLKSYKWRNIDIGSDGVIRLLEGAFQTSYSIEGLTKILDENIDARERGEEGLSTRAESQIIRSIALLSDSIGTEICEYSERLQKKIEALELSK
jgi:hypothetical protein